MASVRTSNPGIKRSLKYSICPKSVHASCELLCNLSLSMLLHGEQHTVLVFGTARAEQSTAKQHIVHLELVSSLQSSQHNSLGKQILQPHHNTSQVALHLICSQTPSFQLHIMTFNV